MDDRAIRALPKVLLHEHLDGGIRPGTVVELADAIGYDGLPTTDPDRLARWFTDAARVGGLPAYLATFEHTIAVLQTVDALERVAYEAGADLAADGVVHAEVRFAPELNTRRGLTIDEVLEAALAGLARASRTHAIGLGLIVDGMRNGPHTTDAAAAAVRWADRGVVGFDIAGPEAGFPPSLHREAFDLARAGGLGITIHAGESYGPASIAQAVRECRADRIGHGVRIVDDIDDDGGLGPVAAEIRDRSIPLEVCPTSNIDTGAFASLADHPVDRLARLGFVVTLNCDNRLMSGTSPTFEMAAMRDTFGWGREDFRRVTLAAAGGLFVDGEVRRDLVDRRIAPGFEAVLDG